MPFQTDPGQQRTPTRQHIQQVATCLSSLQRLGQLVDLGNGSWTLNFPTGIPQNSRSADYTVAASDGGGHIYHPASDASVRTWTIDSNAHLALPIGFTTLFVNDGGFLIIAITSDTLAGMGPTAPVGNMTLVGPGEARALKVTSTRWLIWGTGLGKFPAGIVGWWLGPGGSTSGTTVVDQSGMANLGTLVNSPAFGSGPVAGIPSLTFATASSQYVDLGNSSAFNVTSRYSMLCWVKVASIPSGDYMWMFGKDTNTGRSYGFGISTGGQPGMQINGSNLSASSQVLTVDGLWHHIAAVYDGTTVHYYVDGVAKGTAAGTDPAVTSTHLTLGARLYPANQDYFDGLIADARIYNVAISAADVAAIVAAE